MSILPALKSGGMWLKDIVHLPGNLAEVARADSHLKVLQELAETKKRLEEAQHDLAQEASIKSGRMFFSDNAMWAKDSDGRVEPSPYCAACFELTGKAIHLLTSEVRPDIRSFECPVCQCHGLIVRFGQQ